MHVAAGFGVGFGLFMVEDFLQDSFQEGVFLLRGCGERVGLEDAADGGGQTGAGLLGTGQLMSEAVRGSHPGGCSRR